ncbi:MAG: 50S ribosomal protein L9 [Acidobacteriota bacterium]|jgi:large subunit ribosomal protein L9|nr:50S ribosomal protein L9 [Acidobacteriota bacterium]NLT33686.1 50S ribosomal protein L9 [Acidobacteriota bacterium]
MKVILKQDVEKLGQVGDIVKVAPGYGRNYLIPRKLAVIATPGNIKAVEVEKLAQAKRDLRDKEAASLVASEIVKLTVSIQRKTGEEGALYGSVTALDIAEFLTARNIDVDKRKIQLDEPIKAVGEYQVPVRLHREVSVPIRVVVEPEQEPEAAE